ncbi:MAG: hypothetical protein L0213_05750, partial [Candidatus Dadabacteria bacterium]|nr:hypothetical protein [Candidatus Dadabacteria bacterium]
MAYKPFSGHGRGGAQTLIIAPVLSRTMEKIVVWKIPASKLKGRVLRFEYGSEWHYAVKAARSRLGWSLVLRKERLPAPMKKRERESWIREYKGDTELYAAFVGGEEAGLVQLEYQEWNRSLRVWDILVHP